jgi:hypothetical protein
MTDTKLIKRYTSNSLAVLKQNRLDLESLIGTLIGIYIPTQNCEDESQENRVIANFSEQVIISRLDSVEIDFDDGGLEFKLNVKLPTLRLLAKDISSVHICATIVNTMICIMDFPYSKKTIPKNLGLDLKFQMNVWSDPEDPFGTYVWSPHYEIIKT